MEIRPISLHIPTDTNRPGASTEKRKPEESADQADLYDVDVVVQARGTAPQVNQRGTEDCAGTTGTRGTAG